MNAPAQPDATNHPVLKAYAKLAAEYDLRWSSYVQATVDATVKRLPLRADERVLEVGCGTGALLSRLCERHPASGLVGVDPVVEMLAVARRRLPEALELRESWAEELPFSDQSFHVVVSCNMFHYVRNPERALREMRRVLRAGGRFVLTDWCHDYVACRLCDLYLRLFDRAHFRMYRAGECEQLLKAAGFDDIRLERYKINWFWGLMTATARSTGASAVTEEPNQQSTIP